MSVKQEPGTPRPECFCGAELKNVPLPRDLQALAGVDTILVHVESGDTRCYPDSQDPDERTVTAELVTEAPR